MPVSFFQNACVFRGKKDGFLQKLRLKIRLLNLVSLCIFQHGMTT